MTYKQNNENQKMPLLGLKTICVVDLILSKGTFSESINAETKSDSLMMQ